VVQAYIVDVNFQSIRDDERRRYFLNLPTGFSLPQDDVQQLIDIGQALLEQSPDFSDLLKALRETYAWPEPSSVAAQEPNPL
jgi:hypothetical protein